MTKTKDMNLPWSWRSKTDKKYPKDYDLDCIVDLKGKRVLTHYGNQKKNKNKQHDFIIDAVNAHDLLVFQVSEMRQCLIGLQEKHLNGQSSLVRAIVEKKIDSATELLEKIGVKS